jgi:hypothetical protein
LNDPEANQKRKYYFWKGNRRSGCGYEIDVTFVMGRHFRQLTPCAGARKVRRRRSRVKDIQEVLRRKKAQQEVLGKQIAQLQEAAEELRSIAHLLQEEDHDHSHPGR